VGWKSLSGAKQSMIESIQHILEETDLSQLKTGYKIR
jgi:hypothetical protein